MSEDHIKENLEDVRKFCAIIRLVEFLFQPMLAQYHEQYQERLIDKFHLVTDIIIIVHYNLS